MLEACGFCFKVFGNVKILRTGGKMVEDAFGPLLYIDELHSNLIPAGDRTSRHYSFGRKGDGIPVSGLRLKSGKFVAPRRNQGLIARVAPSASQCGPLLNPMQEAFSDLTSLVSTPEVPTELMGRHEIDE